MSRASSRFFKTPTANKRGKHSSNAGFEKGNHWITCDRCSCDIRYKDSRKTWDGLLVCPDDWEPRHEQDFVRGKADDSSPRGEARPVTTDRFTVVAFLAEEGTGIPPPTFGEPVLPAPPSGGGSTPSNNVFPFTFPLTFT